MTDNIRNHLPPELRLKSSQDFARIFEQNHRVSDRHLLIFGGSNDLEWSRFGLSVSKKHGNAIQRNRKKRLLREAYRNSREKIPTGFDWILIPRVGPEPTFNDYRRSLVKLTNRLAQQMTERGNNE